MKRGRLSPGLVAIWLLALLGSPRVAAEAHWHCSRLPETVGDSGDRPDEGTFQLASMGGRHRAIGITLTDLIEVYEGKPIWVNGRRLNACFLPAESHLSAHALKSLGLNATVMQLQARKSTIVSSHLHLVTDEASMQACIAKNFPAVGYLGQEIRTEQVVPCF